MDIERPGRSGDTVTRERTQRTLHDVKTPETVSLAFAPRTFDAAPWLPGGHAQTFAGWWLRNRTPTVDTRRHEIATEDGAVVTLDIAPIPHPRGVLLVLHGLEGCGSSGYVRETIRCAASRGILTAALNFRSCDGRPLCFPRMYNAGDTEDVRTVLHWLAGRNPHLPRAAIGFSLGGNLLLKLLGEEGEGADRLISSAAAVSVPFDLAAGAGRMERGLGRVYSWHFLRSLRRKVRSHAHLLEDRIDVEAALAARSLREFDDRATAPLHGYAGAAEYYRLSSSADFLDRIRVPTLLIQAEDDPLCGPVDLPRREAAQNPHLHGCFVPRGGHVGFVGGSSPSSPRFWAEDEAVRFVAESSSAQRHLPDLSHQ